MRVLIADDHRLVREALKALLEREGLKVVASAGNGREAALLTREFQPDIAILDLRMPEMNGLDAARAILATCPETGVILLTMHTDEFEIANALRAGVRGYVVKTQAADDLLQAVAAVRSGQLYLSPGIAAPIVAGYLSGAGAPPDALTSREREVLQQVAEGRTSKEIAHALNLSAKTVESYRARVMEKLNIHQTAGLVRYAIKHGLVEL
jgi:two-component system, NarL family, response regulator NreC